MTTTLPALKWAELAIDRNRSVSSEREPNSILKTATHFLPLLLAGSAAGKFWSDRTMTSLSSPPPAPAAEPLRITECFLQLLQSKVFRSNVELVLHIVAMSFNSKVRSALKSEQFLNDP